MLNTSKSYYLSSTDRQDSECCSSDFFIKLDNSDDLAIYDRCVLMSASIPRSYYLIDSRHNTFVLDENGTEYTITITPGNYNVNNFRSTLVGLLNDQETTWTYTVDFSLITGKYTITVADNGGIQPIITISDFRLAEIIGFEEGPNTFSSDTFTSPNVVNFKLSTSLLVYCDIVAPDGVLQDVVVDSRDFSSINYTQKNPLFNAKKFNNTTATVHVKLLDLENEQELINLNGLEWSFTLCFFKHNDYYEKVIMDRKLKLQMIE